MMFCYHFVLSTSWMLNTMAYYAFLIYHFQKWLYLIFPFPFSRRSAFVPAVGDDLDVVVYIVKITHTFASVLAIFSSQNKCLQMDVSYFAIFLSHWAALEVLEKYENWKKAMSEAKWCVLAVRDNWIALRSVQKVQIRLAHSKIQTKSFIPLFSYLFSCILSTSCVKGKVVVTAKVWIGQFQPSWVKHCSPHGAFRLQLSLSLSPESPDFTLILHTALAVTHSFKICFFCSHTTHSSSLHHPGRRHGPQQEFSVFPINTAPTSHSYRLTLCLHLRRRRRKKV